MEMQDLLLASLHRGVLNTRRQCRREPKVENHVEYDIGSDIDEGTLMDTEIGS